MAGLPWSCELVPPLGAVLSVEGSEATPLPVDFLAVVPPTGMALPATLVVVGGEAAPFGARAVPKWAVSEAIGPGRWDTAPSVP